jgi:exodeoxyribonuclease VII small subunit
MSKAKSAGEAPVSFEESMKRLTEIVQSLERGELPLEKSLELFEEGVKLSRLAQERLDGAQKRVDMLLGLDENGKPKTEPFETTPDDDDE